MRTATPPTTHKQDGAHPSREQARFAFYVLLAINILNYVDRSVISSIFPKLQAEFGLSDAKLGLLNSSFLLIYGLCTLPLGVWADKGVRKNIVAVCVTIWSIATALGGFTRNFVQLFITRAFLGIGEAGYAPASLSMIGDYFPKEQRGRMLSLWSIGNLIGTALGLLIGGHVAEAWGWRWVFYLVGLPGLLTAFLIWRVTEPKRGAFEQGHDTENEAALAHGSIGADFFKIFKKLLLIPTYWVIVAAFICSFFITGAALTWVPTFLVREFGQTLSQASNISSGVLGAGSLVGTLFGGWLADSLQRRMPQGRMLVTTIAFLAGAPLTWLALSFHQLPIFITIFVIAIICLTMCLGPIQAIVQDIISPTMRSTAVGLALLLGHLLGDAASPLIIGIISDRTSIGFAMRLCAPLCLLLAGLVCLIGLRTVNKDMQNMEAQLHK
ncbi:spinster family MFS transporter [Tengunoibacter tsumagoiensis]|uniref:MFS transporter n=1 Tax=Tengunoibacter tsumagoiensis TaxID=2014871 RepID=A0A401ZZV3_9CHLR|nr:MFS transporter [Tengunoibacter tsumagoiensis]GCE12322.1 MFS transporter [Tengunoibacter tsumagoiensis]